MAAVDFWVLASAGLAILWTKAHTLGEDKPVAFRFCLWIHGMNQFLPALLLFLAASSRVKLLQSALHLNFDRFWNVLFSEAPSDEHNAELWLPPWFAEDAGFLKHLLLQLSLFVWRAEKLESLLQRMQRSVGVVKREGTQCLTNFAHDPKAYAFDPVWGCTRRVALIAISSFGCAPFVTTTYPTVVLDESLWWMTATLNDTCDRFLQKRNASIPIWVSLIVMPVMDQLHFIPVILQVLLLGLTVYPYTTSAGLLSGVLSLSAVAWSVHNCNLLYHTIIVDVPENTRQWWAARSMAAT